VDWERLKQFSEREDRTQVQELVEAVHKQVLVVGVEIGRAHV
jgi:hypothetical protein